MIIAMHVHTDQRCLSYMKLNCLLHSVDKEIRFYPEILTRSQSEEWTIYLSTTVCVTAILTQMSYTQYQTYHALSLAVNYT